MLCFATFLQLSMPAKVASIQELGLLLTTGGRASRRNEDSNAWQFHYTPTGHVTPQPLMTSSKLSYSSDGCLSHSNVDLEVKSVVEDEFDEMYTPIPRGNRLVNILTLKEALEDFAVCRQCDGLEDLVRYCGIHGCDVSDLFDSWKMTQKQSQCTITVEEATHGLDTDLTLHCNRCCMLGRNDCHGWKNHYSVVESKKIILD